MRKPRQHYLGEVEYYDPDTRLKMAEIIKRGEENFLSSVNERKEKHAQTIHAEIKAQMDELHRQEAISRKEEESILAEIEAEINNLPD